ncbi:unnamed protein product [Sphagnum jensenii]|uniref:Uncharacterized protein n=1 Tax=Sphagnum jensenii TaxID=128206 RepID=A0ABP1ALW6_9BRYO
MPVELTPAGVVPQAETAEDGGAMNRESSIRSKILSHFIKGKVSLTRMETIMMIPGELEQLENLVKVARRKRDAEIEGTQALNPETLPPMNLRDCGKVDEVAEQQYADDRAREQRMDEGPEQMLQLTLQEQANHLMKEEIWESDDYAD